jgi:hypothetical protein
VNRPAHLLVLVSLAAAGCVAADIGEGDEPGLEDIEFQADNGIFLDNGLNLANGMNLGNGAVLHNGMNLGNGIDLANGMNLGNGIYAPPAGSGLEQWIDVEPVMRKKILRYLVECALPRGVEVSLTYRGDSEIFHGVAGLGSSLQQGLMTPKDQERVSSCMLARINGAGVTVQIDMFGALGSDVEGFTTATTADAPFTVLEGAFYGNLFSGAPEAYACLNYPYALPDTRTCKDLGGGFASCGVVEFADDSCGAWRDQYIQCITWSTTDGSRSYFSSCMGGARSWDYAITTYVLPKPDGEVCFSAEECSSGLCPSGFCSSDRLVNGETCYASWQCESDVCDRGVCGWRAGTRCYTNDQCASEVCSLKRKVCL